MVVDKAVPVILRCIGNRLEILMFSHPKAGVQIVKGTVEPGESPGRAALRELGEESGILEGELAGPLGCSTAISPGERWHFYRCRASDLPDRWTYYTGDGGGLEFKFKFFWHMLGDAPVERCDPIFTRALSFIQDAVSQGEDDTDRP